jgi:HEAT repeat protein
MKRQLLAAVLVVAVMVVFLFLVLRRTEPVVNGKPISYWIDARRYTGETFATVSAAYRAMDERSVRWLASQLEWRPAKFRDTLARVVNRVFDDSMPVETPGDRRIEAASALGNLGSRATPAVPALKQVAQTDMEPGAWMVRAAAKATLIRLGQEPLQAHVEALRDTSNRAKWYEVITTLEWLGTNAAPAVAVAVSVVLSTNDVRLRERAVGFLGAVGVNPEICVPALLRVLDEPQLRGMALRSLGRFGPAARNATDAVVACLTDPNRSVQLEASQTLPAINPEKAASLTNNPAR